MIVTVERLKTYYEAVGEGRQVVLLHGWGTDSSSLRPVLKALKENLPARVIALDFPGFGYSQPPGEAWDVSSYTRFLSCFLDELGLAEVDIVAHSFGGRVAIKLAAEYPERIRRLVLVDSAGIRPRPTLLTGLRIALYKTLKKITRAFPGAAHLFRVDRLVARQGSDDYRNAGEMRQTFVKVVNEDLRPWLRAIRCPVLLVWGERDDSTPLEDGRLMAQLIPHAKLEVIPGAGHFSFVDNPGLFNSLAISFLGDNL
ncbi:MAG: alpha/beta hydrolase [Chloroflexi bacterium]|nr:alpha/beta hydrolase [Chloroflexota bacterium]